MKLPALALSFLFHPLLLVSLGAFMIFRLDSIYHVAIDKILLVKFQGLVMLGTFFLPLNTILVLRRFMKNESSIYMEEKQDRRMPLLVCAIFILITFYVFTYKIGHLAPHLLRGYLLGSATSIILASIVSNWYKISLHGIGMGGILGLLAYIQGNAVMDLRLLITIWVVLSGVVMSARYYLGSHSFAQLYTGFLTGFSLIFLIIRL